MAASYTLTETEQAELEAIIRTGSTKGRVRTRAQILLKSSAGWSVAAIAAAFNVCEATVSNTRARFREGGLDLVVHDRVQAKRRRKLTGEDEALLVAITCSPVPEHHDHWTLRLLRDRLITLEVVDGISPATIHAVLKKTTSSRGSTSRGASPSLMRPS